MARTAKGNLAGLDSGADARRQPDFRCSARAFGHGIYNQRVTREIATRLNLPELGKRPLGSAHGEAQVERLLFRIGFQMEEAPLPSVFGEVSGFELKTGFAFNVLIGMDVLSQCDFAMERTGRCRLSFG